MTRRPPRTTPGRPYRCAACRSYARLDLLNRVARNAATFDSELLREKKNEWCFDNDAFLRKTISMGRTSKPKSLSDELREFMEQDGRTLVALAEATGIDKSILSRFSCKKRDLRLSTATLLAHELGLGLRRVRRGG